MKLIPADINEVKRAYAHVRKIIQEFHESDLDCVKVEDWTHKDAGSCAWSLNSSAKRGGYHNIKAAVRKGKVYLIKEEI
jgi:hypothetical protein